MKKKKKNWKGPLHLKKHPHCTNKFNMKQRNNFFVTLKCQIWQNNTHFTVTQIPTWQQNVMWQIGLAPAPWSNPMTDKIQNLYILHDPQIYGTEVTSDAQCFLIEDCLRQAALQVLDGTISLVKNRANSCTCEFC